MNTNSETLLANSEARQALQNKTLAALEDGKTWLAHNNNVLKVLDPQQQSIFLDDRAVTLKDDRGKTFTVDNDMIQFLFLMVKQTNEQLELKSIDPNSNKFKINCIDVFLAPNGIKKVESMIFLRVSLCFFTNKDVTQKDIRGEEKNKIVSK